MGTEQGRTDLVDPWGRAAAWFWPIMLYGISLLTATSDYLRDRRDGLNVIFWDPMSREFISATVLLTLVWIIVKINVRWPLRGIGKIRFVVFHALLSWPFAFLHVVSAAVLITLPHVIFDEAGINWAFIVSRVPAEYPKDAIVYAMILGTIIVYGWARRAVGPQDSVDIQKGGLTVRTRTGLRYVSLDEIDWIEAARNYVILHASGQEFFLRTTMNEMDERMPNPPFRRVHRSAILNLDKLQEITRIGSHNHVAILSSGAQVRIGRQQAAELLRH